MSVDNQTFPKSAHNNIFIKQSLQRHKSNPIPLRFADSRIVNISTSQMGSILMATTAFACFTFMFIISATVADAQLKTTVRAPCGPRNVEQCSFVDRFATFRAATWVKTTGYNGAPFNSRWVPSNVLIDKRQKQLNLVITRRRNRKSGVPFDSGELKSKGRYGYGCYEFRMRPIAKPG